MSDVTALLDRWILASLPHPSIVTLLDGGATADGQAYLVMELVDGAEIVRHCGEHALSLRDRLRLFCTLCEAVQYAHQRGVVRRDLKPANILIGSDVVLKVLDFGVAKLMPAPSDDAATRGLVPGARRRTERGSRSDRAAAGAQSHHPSPTRGH
jgi:serine/threonine-protein kinase